MTSMPALIDFLMSLMRDEKTRMDFERDPDGLLADKGLESVTAADVRDAQLMMSDSGSAHPRHGGSSSGGHNDPVQEIRHTTTTFEIDQSQHTEVGDVNQQFTIFDIDDRDTTVIDSFNSDNDTEVIAIQDNDTTEVINVEDSFNDETDESGETPADGPAEDPEVFIDDPVEAGPEDVPFGTEPEMSIQPVEDPSELDEPDAEIDADAAIA
ncbi:MAG: hypothetical protein GEV28_19830 [Actinophytocola sp.]|uniref:IniB N-terminal domain-containing protein n=1 Tax=Actinophytocola sp. TaxID=1872138 RepID=UPI001320D023|nr:IniB N-terminal domain-containing protein [Actinophytocola sp.]MPZ82526.1 hypothetical protein [Actinophytocola sp.]